MYRELYKQSIDKDGRQELRRQKLLQEQKIKRLEQQDELRELQIKKPHTAQSRFKQHTFQDLYGAELSLQLSEWLREKPDNLDEWILVPCPKGQRCLVVSTRGRTKMFSKAGRFRMSFKSMLPGGGASSKSGGGGFSILDCVYNPENDIFYVLDVLWYGKQCFLDCETQFRFFWLKSKFEEFEEDDYNASKDDNLKLFKFLDSHDMANNEATARTLQTFPLWLANKPELDGFLFYHKESSYTCGHTPLVCWLFPFMVEDVLQMAVNTHYERPPNYSNPWQYMEEFDKELARKQHKRQSKQMDCYNDTDSFNSSMCSPNTQTNSEGEGVEESEIETDELMEMGEKDNTSLKHIMNAERMLELEGNAEL